MREEVLELFNEKKTLSLKELAALLHIEKNKELKELGIVLKELEDERQIYNDHSQYHLIDNDQWMAGSLRDVSAADYAVANKDKRVFIPKNGNVFMDRDEVLVKLGKENEIVHVYDRGITYITGTFIHTRRGLKFRSDVDLHTTFRVTNMQNYALSANMKAVVKVVDYTSPLKVKIVKLLGKENEPGVDVTAILYENEVRMEFPDKIDEELDAIPDHVKKKEYKDRTDLRDLPTVTIDGESTKDFDDAISVKKLKNGGWRLWVHIADVSHYVKEGEEIDEEAFKRGTSIYVADRVVPMLPFQLSNGICSLNPDVDRLTLSCRMDFNAQGIMYDYKIEETVIHSDMRCTYGKVNEYLEDKTSVPEYAPIGEMLQDFSDLATAMQERTKERGHIDFETKEPYFVLDKNGRPVDIQVRDRGWSEIMIEEAMIAANVAVAHELHSKNLPGMFRVHETPDPEKVESIVNMAKALNIPCDINPHDVEPKDIAKFLSGIEDPDSREIMSTIAVRAMQKARYSEDNLGHYGLALEEYCHFTSPIRRYPDLLIHRMLRRHVIKDKNDEKSIKKDEKKMKKSALHLSEMEKEAVSVERAVNDLKSAQFMENKVGEIYDGVISGVAAFGFFVELENTVEGMVPKRLLTDDFYVYDPDTMVLKGENTGRAFTLGQKVKVKLIDVNTPKRQITFEVLGDNPLPAKTEDDFPAVIPDKPGEEPVKVEVKETVL
ncbi:MAG: ribonuclease R [Erysipelotrichaceae bacterium]|nr:ribonuclease R [Erysipelotrichaceae bacterium]